ncbi:MAG: cryptochrome/photolyase family protein [Parachlamydia sp.]|jgi:deoxyribodipyrimidine photolyase-related protein|nr:cryptochrome/photolyase family protein [Parachlamydia sp.]
MNEATLIFPDQLFAEHPSLQTGRPVILAEEFLFFRVQPFHKQRLILLRASMRAYRNFLEKQGYSVTYIASTELLHRGALVEKLKGFKKIHVAEFSDDLLEQDLAALKTIVTSSPKYLCTKKEIFDFFGESRRLSMATFYAWQRKRFDILMESGKPVGGKYSYDKENRRKLPKQISIPPLRCPPVNSFVKEAIQSIEKEFPQAIGQSNPFIYPTTFEEAEEALQAFINERLQNFGEYEDAISQEKHFLFHSVLSPLLNSGLLTPKQVVERVMSVWEKFPLNSIEGFVRQLIGWREFMRASYELKGREHRTMNFFRHQRPLPASFWNGETGILPIDATIQKVLKTGYCHHIERLMVLGNFMLLTERHPDAVYEWFMSCFVDAYDWVMVPNVYGMSQYAGGGSIVTKPYVSSANYLLKMSDYPKGEWCEVWDGLFWRFLKKHSDIFSANPRTRLLLGQLEKNKDSIQVKMAVAENWLQKF